MAENLPGVYVSFAINDDTITTIAAELPTCIVAPLYEVFRKELASANFNSLTTADQDFDWPGKRVGSVVDLSGTRGGMIDSQRKSLAPFPVAVYLVDASSSASPTASNLVSDEYVTVSQDSVSLAQGARVGRDRGNFDVWALEVNGEQFLYNPAGGLSVIIDGDMFDLSGTDVNVTSGGTSTRVFVDEDITSELSTGTRVSEDQVGGVTVSVTPSSTAGRVVVSTTGTDFASEVAGIAVGDVVVVASPLPNFDELQGVVVTNTSTVGSITFPVDITTAEVIDWTVRVDFYDTDGTYTTLAQTSFHKLVSIDTGAGTLVVDSAIPSAIVTDYVEVSILKSQAGYIESINAPLNTELTVVLANTFSDTRSLIDVYTTPTTVTVYPDMNVYVDYRALRSDISDTAYTAASVAEFLATTGHASIDHMDGLGYAVQVATLAQPNDRPVYFVPVDLEPDGGESGLPDNFDYATGYANALESAESVPVYNMICLDQDRQSVKDALKAHVDSMSADETESFRRGYFYSKLPLGNVESSTGELAPGQVVGGIAASATSGNKYIKDANVAFVTDAGVEAGTIIVITSPAEYAGQYVATGDTTDDILMLDGDDWDITKEFVVAGTVNVNTVTGDQVISGAPSGTFVHVEAGDYAEVTVSGTRYRFKVKSVNAAGTQLTCEDEVPGTLTISGAGNGSGLSVIRSWIDPSVQYYITPLTKQQRVDKAVASKTLNGRRYSMFLDQNPTVEVTGGDDVQIAPEYAMIAVAAKRSGLRSFDEISNLSLGGGIISVKHGYNTLKRSQIKQLAQNGIVFLSQADRDAQPYIIDMITTATGGSVGLVSQEEMITANADWMGKTLKGTFVAPPGAQLPNITPRLLGIRAIQIDALLRRWVNEGRLVSYAIRKVEQDPTNKRRTVICLTLVMVIAEKEIAFELELTV